MESNKFGRYKKSDVIAEFCDDDEIFIDNKEGLYTYRQLKDELDNTFNIKINWTEKEKLDNVDYFFCSKEIRGCIALYDIWKHFHTDNI